MSFSPLVWVAGLSITASSLGFAATCPVNPIKITCAISGTTGQSLVVTLEANGEYAVGGEGWKAGKNQASSGSNAFLLDTGKYDLNHMACDIDLLDVPNEAGTVVAIDCASGQGVYGHFESENWIEQGSPCSHVQGTLSDCAFQ